MQKDRALLKRLEDLAADGLLDGALSQVVKAPLTPQIRRATKRSEPTFSS